MDLRVFQGGISMGPYAYRCDDVRPIRFSWPSAAAQRQFAVCVDLRAPKRPSAAFLLRARAKMAETKAILTLSNFSLKIAIGEDRRANAKALFQWSLRPFCCPETGKKYDNLYMYYITTVVCIWP